MIAPSPTSGFHSSYYLGLGWGLAEAIWGIIQGWEQLSLYEDVLKQDQGEEDGEGLGLIMHDEQQDEREGGVSYFERQDELEEADLERKVEALENMRERRGTHIRRHCVFSDARTSESVLNLQILKKSSARPSPTSPSPSTCCGESTRCCSTSA
jgi:hypothetical protein